MNVKRQFLENIIITVFISIIIFTSLKNFYPIYGSNLFQDWIYIFLHQTNECEHTFLFSSTKNIIQCEEYLNSNFVYPKIWLKISNIINSALLYELILILLILIFVYINLKILNKLTIFSKILYFFSPTTILLIERGNNDIVIFILTYLFIIFFLQKKIILSILFLFTGLLLKIYIISILPILLIQNKKKIYIFLLTLFVSIILLYLSNFEYLFNNYNKSGLILSFSSSVYFKILNTIFNFKINYQIVSALILIIIIIFSFNKKINLPRGNNKDEIFFLVSSAILVSNFFLNEGFVYKLAFLSLTFPLIYEYNKLNGSIFHKYVLAVLYLSLYVEFLPFIFQNIFEINIMEFKNNPKINVSNVFYGLSLLFKNFIFWLLNFNLVLISTKIFLKKFVN